MRVSYAIALVEVEEAIVEEVGEDMFVGRGDSEVQGLISDILYRRERTAKIREIGRRHKKNKGIAKTKRNKCAVRFKGGKLQINGGGHITEIKDNTV